jgi:hypothetical protein
MTSVLEDDQIAQSSTMPLSEYTEQSDIFHENEMVNIAHILLEEAQTLKKEKCETLEAIERHANIQGMRM